jgi:hypothetical protein
MRALSGSDTLQQLGEAYTWRSAPPHPTPPLPCHPTPSQIGVGLSDFLCVPLCPLGWAGFAFPILAMPRDAGDLPHPLPPSLN